MGDKKQFAERHRRPLCTTFKVKIRKRADRAQASRSDKRKRRGKSSPLTFSQFASLLFEQNEILPRSKKLTDEMIRTALAAEYAHAYKVAADLKARTLPGGVGQIRSWYNIGRFTKGKPPARPSQRYDEQGDVKPQTYRRLDTHG